MLGDIVSNSSRPTATPPVSPSLATAPRPQRSEGGGYGASSFGEPEPARRPAQPVQPQVARPQFQPQPQAQPVAVQAAAPAQTAAPAQPIAAQPAPITALPPIKAKKFTKLPLVLTIVGIVVFVGGVAGLFIYALGGK